MSYKPNRGKSYWMINSRFQVKQTENTGSQKAADRINAGNCFKTQAEAEQFSKYVTDLAKHGYYVNMPKPKLLGKILTWLAYLLSVLIVLAACCLVIDFIFWIFNINVTVFGIKV